MSPVMILRHTQVTGFVFLLVLLLSLSFSVTDSYLMTLRNLYKVHAFHLGYYPILSLQQPYQVDILIIPILEMKKTRMHI